MKKTVPALFSLFFIICLFCGCNSDDNPKDIEDLLNRKAQDTVVTDEEIAEDTSLNDEFLSVWPDELPESYMNGVHVYDGRPVTFYTEVKLGEWVGEWYYSSMYLYDFPDPEPDFHKFGTAFLYEKKEVIFKYNKQKEDEFGEYVTEEISGEDFDAFIDALTEAGYTDNAERTETTYYCEKYGVGITIVLSNDFPFVEDDPKFHPYPTPVDCCYVKLQLIDPDYVMDLEQIKAEEYRKWLEKH